MKNNLLVKSKLLVPGLVFVGMLAATIVASAATEPVISSITAVSNATSTTISWMTDEGANAQVLYGTSTPYTASTIVTSGFASTTQSVMLSGLTPDTIYHYAVVSSDISGNTDSSTDQTFMTTSAATSTTPAALSTNVASGTPGSTFSLMGTGFGDSEMVNIDFDNATSSAGTDASGTFTTTVSIPTSTVATNTLETITATGVTSGDMANTTFTITPLMATSTPSSSIILNPTMGMPGSTFMVTGANFSPSEMVALNFDGTTSTVDADMNGAFNTTLNVPTGAVSTDTPFTVTATGETSGMMANAMFTIEANTTESTTTLSGLQLEISQLQAIVANLVSELQSLLANQGSGSGSGSGGSYPSSTLSATIDTVGSIRAGTSVDFTGRNWGANEKVEVMNNGSLVTTAQADGGGNFSTGSLSVSDTPGTETYTFTGMTTGLTRSVAISITP